MRRKARIEKPVRCVEMLIDAEKASVLESFVEAGFGQHDAGEGVADRLILADNAARHEIGAARRLVDAQA